MSIKYQVNLAKPEPFTKKERDAARQVYLYRHDAAKVYKLSPEAGKKIKALKKEYVQFDTPQFQLINKKYGISIAYALYFPTDRRDVLRMYRGQIQQKRQEQKGIYTDFSITGYCETRKIHIEPNGVLKQYHKKLLQKPKAPVTPEMHIGVEIELGFPQATTYEKLIPFAKQISITGDGSIHNLPAGHKPEEVRILTTEANYKTELTDICKSLNEMKAVVNETCGLHVHLDMRGVDPLTVKQRFVNLVRSQKYLQGMVTEKRRTNNFCKPTRGLDPYVQPERYYAINGRALQKYNTIEIRLHHGTLDAIEIINWITLLLDIIKGEEIKRAPTTLEKFMEKIKIKPEIKEYVKKKIESNTPVSVNAEDEPIQEGDVVARAGISLDQAGLQHAQNYSFGTTPYGQSSTDRFTPGIIGGTI